jgi:hypothetical protein
MKSIRRALKYTGDTRADINSATRGPPLGTVTVREGGGEDVEGGLVGDSATRIFFAAICRIKLARGAQ